MSMSFASEFRRRNVPQVAVAYLAGAWLLIQVLETLLPIFGQSEGAARPVVILLAIGFIPALVLAWVFEWTPQGVRRDTGATADTPQRTSARFDRVIIALLVLAVGYFAIDKFLIDATPVTTDDRSIIVLPFTNVSSDPEQEYFGDGVAEDLLTLLTRIDELRVISRATAWTYKGRDTGVAELHNELGVSLVLQGSVRKAMNRVRVTAQLIDARTDTQLWSETFDERPDDIFAIQDRISAQIVDELTIHLLGDIPSARRIDAEAYELVLRARFIQRSDNTAAFGEAIEMLQKALEIEPDYVPALYELALLVYVTSTNPSDEVDRVRTIVDRMAEISPDSSYTNSWQAYIALEWDNDAQTAARHLERAIADDPHVPAPLLVRTANMLARLGRSTEAYAVARYNAVRDPACVICAAMLARIARYTGHQREGAEYLESLLTWQPLTPNVAWQLGAAWLAAGEPEKALERFDYLVAASHGNGPLGRLMALHDLGRTEEFASEFAAFREANPDQLEATARIYAWTGQNDVAFEYLERLAEAGRLGDADPRRSPLYDRLSTDPRFDQFLEKHGMTDSDSVDVDFNPPYPPAMRAEIDRLMASIEKGS